PGVGEKTASKLIQDFGSVEEMLAHTDQIKGRLRGAIEAAGDSLVRNKSLARLVDDLDLDVEPEDCVMGSWDEDAVRRLFNSLEFRTLLERLEDVERSAKATVERASLDVRTGATEDLARILATAGPKAVVVPLEGEALRGVGRSP